MESACAQDQLEVRAADGALYDGLGKSVSTFQDLMIAGTPMDDATAGANVGAAYLFQLVGSTWVEKQKITAADGRADDRFGSSVAINENLMVIGALGTDALGTNSGAAYVFRKVGTTWVQEAKLVPSDGSQLDYFGNSVSISGNTILVGAYNDGNIGSMPGHGAAYFYRHNGSTWVEERKLLASDSVAGDTFGFSVSLSGDLALIGAYQDQDNGIMSGSAYVFRRTGTSWTQERKLVPSDGASYTAFGFSVSLSGNLAVIGAYQDDTRGSNFGSAYVFRFNGSTWSQETELFGSDSATNDRFGYTVFVGINSSGKEVALVAAPNAGRTYYNQTDGHGSVYVFSKSATAWVQDGKLLVDDPAPYDYLGESIGFFGDMIVAGAAGHGHTIYQAGAAYSFRGCCDGGTPDPCASLPNGAACTDDGVECTSDVCNNGICTHANKPAGSACGSSAVGLCDNADTCNSSGVCVNNNVSNGTSCADDGNDCTSDTCSNGTCTHAAKANGTACTADTNDCTSDVCTAGTCTHPLKAAGSACGSASTSLCDNADTCSATGVCQTNNLANGTACADDGNECTSDSCSGGVCTHPAKVNGTACTSDANGCTNDVCASGTCAHPVKPAGSACGSATAGLCDNPDTCNASGVCQSNNLANGTACTDDGIECTSDSCSGGVCTHPLKANGTPCNDGNAATSNDQCTSGTCAGTPQCVTSADCNDNNACTTDSCVSGACQRVNNTLACTDDGNACTNDVCSGGSCLHPAKVNGTACGSSANTDCSNPDTCQSGVCAANHDASGTPCTADTNACTNDVCNGGGTCTHPNKPAGSACGSASAGLCDNPDTCSATGVCQTNNLANGTACVDDGNECTADLCNAGTCTHPALANNTPCEDGSVCTDSDSCWNGTCRGGIVLTCDDGDPCTIDVCGVKGCHSTPIVCPVGQTCSDGTCTTGSSCNDGVCDADEDGCNCPGDCLTVEVLCGNRVCDAYAGEDCRTCPQDCRTRTIGPPDKQFCCGDESGLNPDACATSACNSRGWTCVQSPPPCR